MGKLWALLNELQIVENLNLFNLKIPGSWSNFAVALDNFTSFTIIDLEYFLDEFLYVPE